MRVMAGLTFAWLLLLGVAMIPVTVVRYLPFSWTGAEAAYSLGMLLALCWMLVVFGFPALVIGWAVTLSRRASRAAQDQRNLPRTAGPPTGADETRVAQFTITGRPIR